MFCMKCGKPTEGDQPLCPECAMAQEQSTPAAQPAPEVQPQLDLNLEGNAPTEKAKKGSKKTIIAIAAVLAVAVAVVVIGFAFLGWGGTEKTLNDKEAALKAEEAALNGGKGLSGLFSMSSGASQSQTGHTQTLLTLEFGDVLMQMAEQDVVDGELNAEATQFLQLMQKIQLCLDSNTQEELTQIDLGLLLNDTEILALQFISDMLSGDAYIGFPRLNDEYMHLDLEQMLGVDMAQFTETLTQSMQMSQKLEESMPDPEELDEMFDKYILMILSNVDDVKASTKTMDADDLEQSFTVYTYTIDQAAAKKIAKAVLTDAQDDETLRSFITAFCEYYNSYNEQLYQMYTAEFEQYGMYDDYDEFYTPEPLDPDAIFDAIPDLIDELDEVEEDSDDYELILKSYVDASGKICGRTITDSDDSIDLTYITITEGNKKAFELTLDAGMTTFKISGTGTVKNGKLTGSYSLRVMGQVLLEVDLVDFDSEKGTGTIRLGFGKAIQQQLEQTEPDNELIAQFGADIQLELVLEEQDIQFGMQIGEERLFTVGLEFMEKEAFDVQLPSQAVSVENADDMLAWMEGLDLVPFVDDLESAGLPKVLIDALRETDLKEALIQAFKENFSLEIDDSDLIIDDTIDAPILPDVDAPDVTINFDELLTAS